MANMLLTHPTLSAHLGCRLGCVPAWRSTQGRLHRGVHWGLDHAGACAGKGCTGWCEKGWLLRERSSGSQGWCQSLSTPHSSIRAPLQGSLGGSALCQGRLCPLPYALCQGWICPLPYALCQGWLCPLPSAKLVDLVVHLYVAAILQS